jgi:imidazoleglycerol-phosphate dehydratase
MTHRTGQITRNTRETRINLSLNLDLTTGHVAEPKLATGLPFFDHMLQAFACHGRFDLSVDAKGDIEVDPHHLIEDVGIALGEAIRQSIPGYQGILRAGCFSFPMDGTLSSVALDLCGRPNLTWNVNFGSHPVGGLDPNLFREFFKGLTDGMRGTLHVHVVCQDNDHHVIESIFKAFARSLREAVTSIDPGIIMSTKGTLDA